MSKKARQAVEKPWRVEFNECGWSSRYIVVRGYGAEREVLNDGYTDKSYAEGIAEKKNALSFTSPV